MKVLFTGFENLWYLIVLIFVTEKIRENVLVKSALIVATR